MDQREKKGRTSSRLIEIRLGEVHSLQCQSNVARPIIQCKKLKYREL